MPEQALQIAWMRAVLRLHARADVATWTDDEVVATFATIRERPVSFEEWALRMGFNQPPAQQQPAADDPEALVALARATAPNLKVEVQQNG